jgi:hypothetical protein
MYSRIIRKIGITRQEKRTVTPCWHFLTCFSMSQDEYEGNNNNYSSDIGDNGQFH